MYTTSDDIEQGKTHGFGNYDTTITVIDYRQLPPQEIVRSALRLIGHDQNKKQYLPLGYGIIYLTPDTLLKLKYKLSAEEKQEKKLPFASRK